MGFKLMSRFQIGERNARDNENVRREAEELAKKIAEAMLTHGMRYDSSEGLLDSCYDMIDPPVIPERYTLASGHIGYLRFLMWGWRFSYSRDPYGIRLVELRKHHQDWIDERPVGVYQFPSPKEFYDAWDARVNRELREVEEYLDRYAAALMKGSSAGVDPSRPTWILAKDAPPVPEHFTESGHLPKIQRKAKDDGGWNAHFFKPKKGPRVLILG